MYRLPKAEQIENYSLTQNLAQHGYYQCCHTPGLWRHKWRPVIFSLVVDKFGVKYFGKHQVEYLITCIKKCYPVSVDWTGILYYGVSLYWDYKKYMWTFLCKYICGFLSININKNSNTLPAHNTQMVKPRLWHQNSVGNQRKQQTYPPIWRQKIYAKGRSKVSLLCNNSWPHHDGSIRHIIGWPIKSNRRHQRSGFPFTWLIFFKPRRQVEIPCQQHDNMHTQRCIINIIITR